MRRFLAQRKMSSVLMVVPDILDHQPPQMPLIQYDYMVEQVAATVADPALGNAVLPWTLKAGPLWLDAQGLDCLDYLTAEVRRPIEDQIFRRGIVGKCLS
jgi:hypothetical protein